MRFPDVCCAVDKEEFHYAAKYCPYLYGISLAPALILYCGCLLFIKKDIIYYFLLYTENTSVLRGGAS